MKGVNYRGRLFSCPQTWVNILLPARWPIRWLSKEVRFAPFTVRGPSCLSRECLAKRDGHQDYRWLMRLFGVSLQVFHDNTVQLANRRLVRKADRVR